MRHTVLAEERLNLGVWGNQEFLPEIRGQERLAEEVGRPRQRHQVVAKGMADVHGWEPQEDEFCVLCKIWALHIKWQWQNYILQLLNKDQVMKEKMNESEIT